MESIFSLLTLEINHIFLVRHRGTRPETLSPLSQEFANGRGEEEMGTKKTKATLLLTCFVLLLSSKLSATTVEKWLEKANTPLTAVPGEVRKLFIKDMEDIRQPVPNAISFLSVNKDKYPKLSILSGSILRVDDDGRLFLTFELSEYNSDIAPGIQGLGGRIEHNMGERYGFIEAWIPYDKVVSAAKISGVRNIGPTPMGFSQTGSVTSEGDTLHHSDDLRSESSYDGSGITVGVISDGCTNWTDARDSGDLPSSVNVIDNSVGGDEGTAMMEIVYDLAPGAALAFSEGVESPAEFINAVDSLAIIGCDVIVDDITWSSEPFFEDGSIADACNNAVDGGVFYCSSAGNYREDHYQGIADLTPGPVTIHGDSYTNVHAWDGVSDHTFYATAPSAPYNGTIILQWSDKWGLSNNDYDLYVHDADADTLIAASTYGQNGNDAPYEFVSFPGLSRNVDIVVHRYSGDETPELELYFWGSWSNYEYNTPENSTYGHAVAENVVGVAAQRYYQSSTEYFSSVGPATLYWPGGSSYTRDQPLITGCDGGKITGAGGFGSPGGSGYNRFYGTSAAAPHVAGLAALALDMDDTLTPAEVKNMLINSATDIEDAGYDYKSGWGKANVVSWANSNNVTSTGTYDFEDVSINFTELVGSGTVYVECYPGVFPDNLVSGNPVKRKFIITNPSGITSFSAELTLSYIQQEFDDSDIPDETSLYCARWTGSAWSPYASTVNTVSNTVTCTTSDFSDWGIGGTDGSLPVELNSFAATVSDGNITLKWATESEVDNLGFHVYRATAKDGVYDRITPILIQGAGNSSTRNEYIFTDSNIVNGVTYWYKLEDVAYDGRTTTHGPIAATIARSPIPDHYDLAANFPNPFNPHTVIAYQLPEPSGVRLTIYNAAGQIAEVLVEKDQNAGFYQVLWDANGFASGVYFYRLEAGSFVRTRKMVKIE